MSNFIEYIYFDDDYNAEYSSRTFDKYNTNQFYIKLGFKNKQDRTIILNSIFKENKRAVK
jgi:hypothetical protein